ncbi:PASTA domain-containing protein [Nocardioides sp. B-3]|uniref:PASTA domain-containing protein n=1 Tax=Nocardioides sp. B-3 TaxID=2895565 RepID=UPI00300E6CDE
MAVWFVGYTPQIATAAMVAGANSLGHWVSLNGQTVGGSYISEAFGSTVAGPIWGDAMAAISARLDYEDFRAPAGDEIAGVLTTVPDVSGMSVKDARAKLESYGFVTELAGFINSSITADAVAGTTPAAGTSLGSGDTVGIYQSTGYVPPPPPTNKGGKKGGDDDDGKGNNGNGKGRGNR